MRVDLKTASPYFNRDAKPHGMRIPGNRAGKMKTFNGSREWPSEDESRQYRWGPGNDPHFHYSDGATAVVTDARRMT
jgi:hypothetical protein